MTTQHFYCHNVTLSNPESCKCRFSCCGDFKDGEMVERCFPPPIKANEWVSSLLITPQFKTRNTGICFMSISGHQTCSPPNVHGQQSPSTLTIAMLAGTDGNCSPWESGEPQVGDRRSRSMLVSSSGLGSHHYSLSYKLPAGDEREMPVFVLYQTATALHHYQNCRRRKTAGIRDDL